MLTMTRARFGVEVGPQSCSTESVSPQTAADEPTRGGATRRLGGWR
jgi:hypothetical protein